MSKTSEGSASKGGGEGRGSEENKKEWLVEMGEENSQNGCAVQLAYTFLISSSKAEPFLFTCGRRKKWRDFVERGTKTRDPKDLSGGSLEAYLNPRLEGGNEDFLTVLYQDSGPRRFIFPKSGEDSSMQDVSASLETTVTQDRLVVSSRSRGDKAIGPSRIRLAKSVIGDPRSSRGKSANRVDENEGDRHRGQLHLGGEGGQTKL